MATSDGGPTRRTHQHTAKPDQGQTEQDAREGASSITRATRRLVGLAHHPAAAVRAGAGVGLAATLAAGVAVAFAMPASAAVPTSASAQAAATTRSLPHWGSGPATPTNGWTAAQSSAAPLAGNWAAAAAAGTSTGTSTGTSGSRIGAQASALSGARAAAAQRAAAQAAAARAASTHASAFTPGTVNRTVVGGTPTTAWAPPTRPGSAGKGTASTTDTSGTGAKLSTTQALAQTSTPSAAQSEQLSASGASAQTTPTTGFPGAGASGAGLGIQSYYGLKSFNLTSTLTAGVNLANGNLVVRDQALTRNAPGLSVNLDTFFNTLNTAQGSLSYGGSLSTGQDIGLQVGTSTTTFYGPSATSRCDSSRLTPPAV